jgi:protein SCO1/2
LNKKALYAVMLALLLPLAGYFIVKYKSEELTIMPGHYFPDSVVVKVKRGKEVRDTIWHTLPDFSLVNQMGDTVSWKEMHGKIIIADFFFTHCPTICPTLTKNVKRLQESITNSQKVGDKTNQQVHFLSFTIDPERDSVQRLKYWADRFQINPEKWWLLTGNKQTIYDMALKEMRIGIEDGQGIDTNFFHTDHLVLIDTNHYVRGYYHGLDSISLSKLSQDIVLLTLEKDPKEKNFFAGKLQLIAVVFLLALVGVGLLLLAFRKKLPNAAATTFKKE